MWMNHLTTITVDVALKIDFSSLALQIITYILHFFIFKKLYQMQL